MSLFIFSHLSNITHFENKAFELRFWIFHLAVVSVVPTGSPYPQYFCELFVEVSSVMLVSYAGLIVKVSGTPATGEIFHYKKRRLSIWKFMYRRMCQLHWTGCLTRRPFATKSNVWHPIYTSNNNPCRSHRPWRDIRLLRLVALGKPWWVKM